MHLRGGTTVIQTCHIVRDPLPVLSRGKSSHHMLADLQGLPPPFESHVTHPSEVDMLLGTVESDEPLGAAELAAAACSCADAASAFWRSATIFLTRSMCSARTTDSSGEPIRFASKGTCGFTGSTCGPALEKCSSGTVVPRRVLVTSASLRPHARHSLCPAVLLPR
jgi:hypothetical protein